LVAYTNSLTCNQILRLALCYTILVTQTRMLLFCMRRSPLWQFRRRFDEWQP